MLHYSMSVPVDFLFIYLHYYLIYYLVYIILLFDIFLFSSSSHYLYNQILVVKTPQRPCVFIPRAYFCEIQY